MRSDTFPPFPLDCINIQPFRKYLNTGSTHKNANNNISSDIIEDFFFLSGTNQVSIKGCLRCQPVETRPETDKQVFSEVLWIVREGRLNLFLFLSQQFRTILVVVSIVEIEVPLCLYVV